METTNPEVKKLMTRISMWPEVTIKRDLKPKYIYGYGKYNKLERTPIVQSITMTIENHKHNVAVKFDYWNPDYLLERLAAINNYFSSLEASEDALGLLDKELIELKKNSKELIECQYLYMHGKHVEYALVMKWGSKTYVQKQYDSYLARCEAIQKKKEAITKKVEGDAFQVKHWNMEVIHMYNGPRYTSFHMHTDFSTVGRPLVITDDDLPF